MSLILGRWPSRSDLGPGAAIVGPVPSPGVSALILWP